MKNFILFFLVSLLLDVDGQAPSWTWAKSGGGIQNDYAGGNINYASSSIATDHLGNNYVTGLFKGSATFGTVTVNSGTVPNVFIAKYDLNGTCMWVQNFGGNDADVYGNHGCGTSVDKAGNVYVTGTFHGSNGQIITVGTTSLSGTGGRQVFLVKLDANGNFLWARQPLSSMTTNNYATSVSADTAGNCCVTGYLGGGTTTFGSAVISTYGGYVVKYDANGTALWGKSTGASTDAACVHIDSKGNVLITGYAQGPGSFATTPPTTFTTVGMRDIFVSKFSSSGTYLWISHFGGTSLSSFGNAVAYGKGVGADSVGNIYVTGDFNERVFVGNDTLKSLAMSSDQAHFIKLDPNGQPLWARQTVASNTIASGNAEGTAITVRADGRSFVTGMFYTSGSSTVSAGAVAFPPSGNQSVFVLNLDPAGNFNWGAFTSSENSICYPSGISCDPAENIYISGTIQGATSFGGHLVTPVAKGSDVTIAKLGNNIITVLSERLKNQLFAIYPNPFSTELFVDGSDLAKSASDLILFDGAGRLVLSTPIVAGGNKLKMPLLLAPGIYFYELRSGESLLQRGRLIRH